MVYKFGKICIYTLISFSIALLIHYSKAEFFYNFLNGLIPLLATLTAIYITSNSLIIIELNRIKDKHSNVNVSDVIKEIKSIFITQIILISSLTFAFILKDFLLNIHFECSKMHAVIIFLTNSFAIGAFSYFIEALYDTGCTLFTLIDFNNK